MKTFTNIDELEKHLRQMFYGITKSKEIEKAAKDVSLIMGKNVMNRINMSPYDYDQSGDFRDLMKEELRERAVYIARTSVVSGFGQIDNLNDTIWMRRAQDIYISSGTRLREDGRLVRTGRSFRTRPEKEMPKWIVLEFGIGTLGEKKVPREFRVRYTKRPQRQYLVGPSERPPREHKKNAFVMLDRVAAQEIRIDGKARKHPGIKPGRFFRKGLEDSIEPINERYGEAIKAYLDSL